MGELKNVLLDWCNKPRNIDKFLYNFDIQNNYSSSKCFYLHVCTTAIVNVTEIRGNIPSSLLLQSCTDLATYNNCKSTNRFKALIVISPGGLLRFVSSLYTGCISDICNLLNNLDSYVCCSRVMK